MVITDKSKQNICNEYKKYLKENPKKLVEKEIVLGIYMIVFTAICMFFSILDLILLVINILNYLLYIYSIYYLYKKYKNNNWEISDNIKLYANQNRYLTILFFSLEMIGMSTARDQLPQFSSIYILIGAILIIVNAIIWTYCRLYLIKIQDDDARNIKALVLPQIAYITSFIFFGYLIFSGHNDSNSILKMFIVNSMTLIGFIVFSQTVSTTVLYNIMYKYLHQHKDYCNELLLSDEEE